MTIRFPLYYHTCMTVENGTSNKYYQALDKVLRIYNHSGYIIKSIECDGEYKSLMECVTDDMDVVMNYTNAKDHVPREE